MGTKTLCAPHTHSLLYSKLQSRAVAAVALPPLAQLLEEAQRGSDRPMEWGARGTLTRGLHKRAWPRRPGPRPPASHRR